MSVNPYPILPRDKGNNPMQQFPAAKVALEEYASDNSSASSVISVTHDTTTIEVAAIGGPAVLKWITTSDTTASVVSTAGASADFDHVIPTATIRQFALPIEGPLFQAPSSMVGANRQNSLYQRVAIKSIGVASVLLTEY